MTKAKTRYFLLYADGKTVKEISHKEWFSLLSSQRDMDVNTNLVVRVHPSEFYFRKGKRFFWIRRRQLEQVLTETKEPTQ